MIIYDIIEMTFPQWHSWDLLRYSMMYQKTVHPSVSQSHACVSIMVSLSWDVAVVALGYIYIWICHIPCLSEGHHCIPLSDFPYHRLILLKIHLRGPWTGHLLVSSLLCTPLLCSRNLKVKLSPGSNNQLRTCFIPLDYSAYCWGAWGHWWSW